MSGIQGLPCTGPKVSGIQGLPCTGPKVSGIQGLPCTGPKVSGIQGLPCTGPKVSGIQGLPCTGPKVSGIQGLPCTGPKVSGVEGLHCTGPKVSDIQGFTVDPCNMPIPLGTIIPWFTQLYCSWNIHCKHAICSHTNIMCGNVLSREPDCKGFSICSLMYVHVYIYKTHTLMWCSLL